MGPRAGIAHTPNGRTLGRPSAARATGQGGILRRSEQRADEAALTPRGSHQDRGHEQGPPANHGSASASRRRAPAAAPLPRGRTSRRSVPGGPRAADGTIFAARSSWASVRRSSLTPRPPSLARAPCAPRGAAIWRSLGIPSVRAISATGRSSTWSTSGSPAPAAGGSRTRARARRCWRPHRSRSVPAWHRPARARSSRRRPSGRPAPRAAACASDATSARRSRRSGRHAGHRAQTRDAARASGPVSRRTGAMEVDR